MDKMAKFEASRENMEWLSLNYDSLKKKFAEKWIILQDKTVVESATKYDEIMKLTRKYDADKIMVEYMQSEPIAMFF